MMTAQHPNGLLYNWDQRRRTLLKRTAQNQDSILWEDLVRGYLIPPFLPNSKNMENTQPRLPKASQPV
jgi:hypothetical protein